jgi:hypothetical protein
MGEEMADLLIRAGRVVCPAPGSSRPGADVSGVERPGGCWEAALTVRAGEPVAD